MRVVKECGIFLLCLNGVREDVVWRRQYGAFSFLRDLFLCFRHEVKVFLLKCRRHPASVENGAVMRNVNVDLACERACQRVQRHLKWKLSHQRSFSTFAMIK